jgi:hypothetical protein
MGFKPFIHDIMLSHIYTFVFLFRYVQIDLHLRRTCPTFSALTYPLAYSGERDRPFRGT